MPPTFHLLLSPCPRGRSFFPGWIVVILGLLPLFANAQPAETVAVQTKLRGECEKFELLPWRKDASGKAVMQYVDSTKNFYLDGGYRYFGFRFNAPTKISGDFCWMFLLRNQHERITISRLDWNIVPRKTGWQGFRNFEKRSTSRYPELAAQFPNTNTVFIQYQDKEYFQPGEEYIIFFRIPVTDKTPEIVLAFTFLESDASEGLAKLPLGSSEPRPKKPTSYEGDPW